MNDRNPDNAKRLLVRERPEGLPIMHQSWGKLLFMHWRFPVEALRAYIPGRLGIDTFDGMAWVTVTPFTVWDAHPRFVPPLPFVSDFHEINVRTYVHLDGVPGVWFFSLDANSLVVVTGARTFFHLPYYHASISLKQEDDTIIYSARRHAPGPFARFDATWTVGDRLRQAEPETLEFFLVERYCLYTAEGGKLYRCRIHHQPWPLRDAILSSHSTDLFEADGLPKPLGEPLVDFGGPVNVEVWPLEEV
jgi:uncharacterized protein YqjF (DUF2071 family)